VGKREDEIRAAVEADIRSLNVESLEELEEIADAARPLGHVAPVSVRLNPDVAGGGQELAGAYGRVMSSTYNARPLCAEVVLEQGSWRVSRERGTYDDLVRNERI
jgi:diaminopimelate decarboxylase